MSYRLMRRPVRPTGEYIPFARSNARQVVARKMNPRNWALSFVGAVLGVNEYKDSPSYVLHGAVLVIDRSNNGRYVKVVRLHENGTTWGREYWAHSSHWYRLYDSLEIFKLYGRIKEAEQAAQVARNNAEQAAAANLSLLSQNTVTRALVHAHSNDYCSETAVALISAGHKMPDVTLSFQITLDIDVNLVGNKSYYQLRALFGATNGEVEGASGVSAVEHSDKVSEAIREAVAQGDYTLDYYSGGIKHTGTSVDWHTPILRQVENHVAYAQVNHHDD